MKKPTKINNLPVSMVFLQEHHIITPTGAGVVIRTLSFKELEQLTSRYGSQYSYFYNVAKLGLLGNIDEMVLSIEDIEFVAKAILKISTLTNEVTEDISLALDLEKEDTFKGEDFQCSVCQDKGLDKNRNCPLLSGTYHDKSVFYIVGDKKLDKCPMDKINSNNFKNDIYTLFNLYNNKTLPEAGGMVDQTQTFWYMAPYITGRLKAPVDDLEE